MAKKRIPFVVGRPNYVLNAKRQIFGDRRTKRMRDRAGRDRQALDESSEQ